MTWILVSPNPIILQYQQFVWGGESRETHGIQTVYGFKKLDELHHSFCYFAALFTFSLETNFNSQILELQTLDIMNTTELIIEVRHRPDFKSVNISFRTFSGS